MTNSQVIMKSVVRRTITLFWFPLQKNTKGKVHQLQRISSNNIFFLTFDNIFCSFGIPITWSCRCAPRWRWGPFSPRRCRPRACSTPCPWGSWRTTTSAEEQVFAVSPEHYSSTQTTASTTVTHGLTIFVHKIYMRKRSFFRCNKYVRHKQNTHTSGYLSLY